MLDIDNIDLAMGKMMEQGPVLVITFNSQQILCVRDRTGKVIEGSPDKVRLGEKFSSGGRGLCVRGRNGKVMEGSPDKVRSGVKQLWF